MNEEQTFASVWDAVADTPAEAANLRARAELKQEIANIVKESGLTQAEAAARQAINVRVTRRMGCPSIWCGVDGRLDRFPIELTRDEIRWGR